MASTDDTGADGPRAPRPTRPTDAPRSPPVLGPGRTALYVSMVVAAVVALFLDPAIEGAVDRGALASGWALVPVAVFTLMFFLYAADRWWVVRHRRYRPGRALLQTGLGLVLTTAVISSLVNQREARREASAPRPTDPERLLGHADPSVRAAAVYALGFRGEDRLTVERLVGRLEDRSPQVRQAAREVLSRWSGLPEADLSGIRGWASSSSRTSTSHAREEH